MTNSGVVEFTLKRGFKTLRFPAQLERQFNTETINDRYRQIVRLNYIGLAIYFAMIGSDALIVDDVFRLDLLIHVLIVMPMVAVINGLLARRPPFWVCELLCVLGHVVLAGTLVWITSASRAPDRDMLLSTMGMILLFGIIVQRLRFPFFLISCLALQLIYTLGLTTLDSFSVRRMVMSSCIFAGTLFLFLLACYRLEYEERLTYLLTLRDRFSRRELERASLRDPLTSVGNRRALDAALQRLDSAKPSDELAVLLLDIDHFKLFNDTNGHQEGDGCLRRVAGVVAQSLSPNGTVYRFGGEEFLVLLHPSTLAEALAEAERIRSAIAEARIPSSPTAASVVSISIGVVSGRLDRDRTTSRMVSDADAALYKAKRNGRNQVAGCDRPTKAPTGRAAA